MKKKTQNLTVWTSLQLAFVVTFISLIPEIASAYAIGYVICDAAALFRGNVGRGLATIGVSIIGVGALLGKVSWGLALIVGVGIAVIFNATAIVGYFGYGSC